MDDPCDWIEIRLLLVRAQIVDFHGDIARVARRNRNPGCFSDEESTDDSVRKSVRRISLEDGNFVKSLLLTEMRQNSSRAFTNSLVEVTSSKM